MKNKFLFEYDSQMPEVLTERKDTGEVDVKVCWQQADKLNKNNRIYSKKLLSRVVKEANEKIASGETIWGLPYHPLDGFGRASDISHYWKKLWLEDDGRAMGVLTLLPTSEGKNLQILARGGRKLGISSRGMGEVNPETHQVSDGYMLLTPGDFTLSPSVEGAATVDESIRLNEQKLNEGDIYIDNRDSVDVVPGDEDDEEVEDESLENRADLAAQHLAAAEKLLGIMPPDESEEEETSESAEPEMSESEFMIMLEKFYRKCLGEGIVTQPCSFEQFRVAMEGGLRIQYHMNPNTEFLIALDTKLRNDAQNRRLFEEYKLGGGKETYVEWCKRKNREIAIVVEDVASPYKNLKEVKPENCLVEAQISGLKPEAIAAAQNAKFRQARRALMAEALNSGLSIAEALKHVDDLLKVRK